VRHSHKAGNGKLPETGRERRVKHSRRFYITRGRYPPAFFKQQQFQKQGNAGWVRKGKVAEASFLFQKVVRRDYFLGQRDCFVESGACGKGVDC
jgi:hypothetical protein